MCQTPLRDLTLTLNLLTLGVNSDMTAPDGRMYRDTLIDNYFQ